MGHEIIEKPDLQQLSAMLASVLDEFLAIKDKLPELEQLGERLDETKNVVATLQGKIEAIPPPGNYEGYLMYRALDGTLYTSQDTGQPMHTSFSEDYLLQEGCRWVSIHYANDKSWPI